MYMVKALVTGQFIVNLHFSPYNYVFQGRKFVEHSSEQLLLSLLIPYRAAQFDLCACAVCAVDTTIITTC
jgi:hypothetical protein